MNDNNFKRYSSTFYLLSCHTSHFCRHLRFPLQGLGNNELTIEFFASWKVLQLGPLKLKALTMSYFPIAKHLYKFSQCLLFFANLLSCASFCICIVVEIQLIMNMNNFHTPIPLLAGTEGRKTWRKERKEALCQLTRRWGWIRANPNANY
jgi:hypothetical protein